MAKSETSPPASILSSDLDVALRMVRDLFSSDIDRLWCDDPETYERIVEFVQNYMPRLRARITIYQGEEPIFDHFKIEPQIDRALERKVWLKSGGYLVFDQAEALTAIDVNTGRFVGKSNQDETVLQTNLEAADEVVKQLRLRNIGGIIIVDFIDMTREADRKQVSDVLARGAAARQGAHLGAQDFRTRAGPDDPQAHARKPRGTAHRHLSALRGPARREIRADARRRGPARRPSRGPPAEPRRHAPRQESIPRVARYLYDLGARDLEALERRVGIKIVLRAMEGLEPGSFELSLVPAAA